MSRGEVTTQAQLDKALAERKPGDRVCLGGTSRRPLRASGPAIVYAYDTVTVHAYDTATVRASDTVTVYAYDSATVYAYDSATVHAYDSATVYAYGTATVHAYGSVTVYAYGSATVRASPYVAVHKMPGHTGTVNGSVAIEVPEIATAAAWAGSEPREILRKAAVAVMGEVGGELRRRGWAVELIVDYVEEKDTYAVSLRFELPLIPAPIEAGRTPLRAATEKAS